MTADIKSNIAICISIFGLIVSILSLIGATLRVIYHKKQVDLELSKRNDDKRKQVKDISDKFDNVINFLESIYKRWDETKSESILIEEQYLNDFKCLENLILDLPQPYKIMVSQQLYDSIGEYGGGKNVSIIKERLNQLIKNIKEFKIQELTKFES